MFGTISIGLVADEKIAPTSPWQKVKTALTSKPAKIIYGSLGIAAGGGLTYVILKGKRAAVDLDKFLTENGEIPISFFNAYGLDHNKLGVEKFADRYCYCCLSDTVSG